MSDTQQTLGSLTVKPGLGYDGSHSKPRPYCWLGKRQIVPPEQWSGCDTATAWLEGFTAGVKQSAAPELLEACELAEATIERLNRHDSANGTLDVIRAAIAKATQ